MNWLRINSPHNWLNASLGRGIAQHGFRKWYERELLSGHAHMVLCLLATLALMASMEAFAHGSMIDKLADVAFVLICAAIGLWALRRYLFLLTRAEHIANQANCPNCQTYGLLQAHRPANLDAQPVRCKKCGHEWDIELG
jgi:Zn ribbon nucleic-acid-binding protein